MIWATLCLRKQKKWLRSVRRRKSQVILTWNSNWFGISSGHIWSNAVLALNLSNVLPFSTSENPGKRRARRYIVSSLLSLKCLCGKDCLSSLSPDDVISSRDKFDSMNQTEQRQWMLNYMFESTKEIHAVNRRSGKIKLHLNTHFILKGKLICSEAWSVQTLRGWSNKYCSWHWSQERKRE